MQAQRSNNLNANPSILLNNQARINGQIQLPNIKQNQTIKKNKIGQQKEKSLNNDIEWQQIHQNNIFTETLNSNQYNSQSQSNLEISDRKRPTIKMNLNHSNILLEENNPDSKFKLELNSNQNEKVQAKEDKYNNLQTTTLEKSTLTDIKNQSQSTYQIQKKQNSVDQMTQSSVSQLNFNKIVDASTDQILQNHYYYNDIQDHKQYFNTNQILNKKSNIYLNSSIQTNSNQKEDSKHSKYEKYMPNRLLKPIQKQLTGLSVKQNPLDKSQNNFGLDESIIGSHIEFQKSYQNFVNRKFDQNNYILQQKNLRSFIKSQLEQKYTFQTEDFTNMYQNTIESGEQQTKLEESIQILQQLKMEKSSSQQIKEPVKQYISSDSLKKIQNMIDIEPAKKIEQNPYDHIIKGHSVQIERFKSKKEIPKLSKVKLQQKQFFLKISQTHQSQKAQLPNLNKEFYSGNQSSLMSNRIKEIQNN